MKFKALFVVFSFSSALIAPANVWAASREPVHGKNGMVASTSEIASQVGVEILKKGGNAVDAAIAVAFTLAVTWPSGGNIGGGGFMLIRDAKGESEVIDYRETAPSAATRDMYLDSSGNVVKGLSTVGYRGIGVPGTVAGLALAHKRHGRLSWEELVEPARKIASRGFRVNYALAKSIEHQKALLKKFPESARVYLHDGKPYLEDEVLKLPDLAKTLARIEKHGASDFYEGKTAQQLVRDIQTHAGILTLDDFKSYKAVVRKPLVGTYRGFDIVTMPPPSSGGAVLINSLNMLEGKDLRALGFQSADSLHNIVETMKRAFADRAEYMGDTDFVRVPLLGFLSKSYAVERAKTIVNDRATRSTEIKAGEPARYESKETTHFTVVDRFGNVVSNTYTLNGSFGGGAVAKGTGVLLNNEMDDFTSKPGSPNMYGLIQNANNAIAPHKRPLSSMTPTIVTKNGKLAFAIGSPGGPTIINTVLQITLNIIDYGMNIQQAIDAPRFHHQWMPDKIEWEPYGISKETKLALEKRGHIFAAEPGYIGDAQGIEYDSEHKIYWGASDPRWGGVAVGY